MKKIRETTQTNIKTKATETEKETTKDISKTGGKRGRTTTTIVVSKNNNPAEINGSSKSIWF